MEDLSRILLETELQDTNGEKFKLSSINSPILIVYFYPRAMTPGCTREGVRFNELIEEFEKCNAVVVGVSTDPPQRNKKFMEKHGFRFKLLSDVEGVLAGKLGILKKGTKKPSAKRTTFILKDGKIVQVLKNIRPAERHADEALKIVKELMKC